MRDAERVLRQFHPVPLHRDVELPGGARLLLRRAGHILGASTAQIDIGGVRIVFSGDLGRYDDPVMYDPEPVPEADYVVTESTYGNRAMIVEMPSRRSARSSTEPSCAAVP